MQKNIICVACPMGCGVTVELDDNGSVVSVTGNTLHSEGAVASSQVYALLPKKFI